MDEKALVVFQRIAVALERQVRQHDESVERGLRLRDENIQRESLRRDAELAEAREVNRQLIEKMAEAVAIAQDSNARVRALEAVQSFAPPASINAVDPQVQPQESRHRA